MHSDSLLPLDELSQCNPREARDTAYMLGNGLGKTRAGRNGQARQAVRFRGLFLSTGEESLSDKNAEAGMSTKAGQEVRLADVPADAGQQLGLFEDLHSHDSADAFSRHLKAMARKHYGTAMPAFLERLTDKLRRDPDYPSELKERVAAIVRRWLETVPEAGGQVRRVASRFALVAIGGEIAGKVITGWEAGDAEAVAEACCRAWLANRGTAGAREDEQAVEQLRAFILRHGESRFTPWAEPAPLPDAAQCEAETSSMPAERFRAQHRAGFRRWVALPDGRMAWRDFLTSGGMKEALTGLAPREATRTLADRGFIVASHAASDIKKGVLTGLHRIPKEGSVRLYEVSDTLLATGEAEG
jgi:hypothetical protein